MLKVLIVDDEVLARVGVKSLIPWHENNYELIGECDNGKSALKLAKVNPPDIIITDIKMPVMDGITLMSTLKEQGSKSKFIMLSSYDDFDLVRESLKIGADDYLLKLQLEPEQLLEVLGRLREKIEKENELDPSDKVNDGQRLDDFRELKDKFIKGLLYGEYFAEAEIKQYMRLYNIMLPPQNLICLVVKINTKNTDMDKEDPLFVSSITSIISEGVKNYGSGQVTFNAPDSYSVICSLNVYDDSELLHQAIDRMASNMQEYICNSMNVSISIGISKVYRGFRFIAQAYIEASEALGNPENTKSGKIVKYSEIENQEGAQLEYKLDKDLNDLTLVLKSNNLVEIELVFNRLILKLTSMPFITKKYLIGNSHIFIFIINEFIEQNHLKYEELWGSAEKDYLALPEIKNIEDYILWVEHIKNQVILILNKEQEYNTMILRTKQYVKNNVKNNITLPIIADHLGLSPSYFSRLFSKETGQGFIDYVTCEKISLAKELIQSSNMKVYEIAEEVGYENAYYFSRVFKKVTGMSPMEYKNGINHKSAL